MWKIVKNDGWWFRDEGSCVKDMEGLIPHYGHRGRDFYISIESGIQGVFEFGLRVELLVLALPSELWPIGLVRSSSHGDLTPPQNSKCAGIMEYPILHRRFARINRAHLEGFRELESQR